MIHSKNQIELWTVGHSNRSLEEFLEVIQSFKIATLVDVRTYPGSRRLPQFNKENLAASLEAASIKYVHMPELGGRRHAQKDSTNIAWRNEGFRGYADYMETDEFREGAVKLCDGAGGSRTAIMCAEAVWWRCHRSLISDYLKARGDLVTHILAAGKAEPHPYTSAARIIDGKLSYKALLAGEL